MFFVQEALQETIDKKNVALEDAEKKYELMLIIKFIAIWRCHRNTSIEQVRFRNILCQNDFYFDKDKGRQSKIDET